MKTPQSFQLVSAMARRALVVIAAVAVVLTALPQSASAYPIYAQQQYTNPREATGRIVCANCHLAKKPTEVEIPQSVLPDTVFEAVVKLPYDLTAQQLAGDGSPAGLNVGAVMVLPEGFTLAPEDRIPEDMREAVEEMYIQPYSDEQPNILVVGPLPGEQYQELKFPILSPNPATDKAIKFGKYQVHVGGNRGRGQIYPTGARSNNNVFTASVAGTIASITPTDDGGVTVAIQGEDGTNVDEAVLPGGTLLVAAGDTVTAGQALTTNPNVGGFGQLDKEIVLQNPDRVKGLLAFFFIVTLSQIMLVLKKKQVEKVQAAEMNF
jgi:apocytochrome f